MKVSVASNLISDWYEAVVCGDRSRTADMSHIYRKKEKELEYFLAGIIGLAFGVLAGLVKYFLIWKRPLKSKKQDLTLGSLYLRMGLSFLFNVLVLAIVFFTRNLVDLNFTVLILLTAVGLSLMLKLTPMKQALEKYQEDR